MKIIFVTRRYPPSVGGVQTFSANLQDHLSAQHDVTLVSLGRDSPFHLAWFVPYAIVRGVIGVLRGADFVYYSEGVMAAITPLLRLARRGRFAVTVQGLEVTYQNPLVARIIRRGIQSCDVIIAGSENTRSLMADVGIAPNRTVAIHCGVEPPPLDPAAEARLRENFSRRTGVRLGEERVLLNIGRQVARKGLAEFITDVVPLLDPVPAIVICGTGPEHERLKDLVAHSPHSDRIHLLGYVDDDTTTMLRRSSSLFLMPNISVAGDAEGFGIAPLEAMYEGLPVVGYAVDALPESLREGGWLIPAGDAAAYARCINEALAASPSDQAAKREEARAYVRREYDWADVAASYLVQLERHVQAGMRR